MRGTVAKLIMKKATSEINKADIKGKGKLTAIEKGYGETKKQYKRIGKPALPEIVCPKKMHKGDTLLDFRKRRRIANVKRRERERNI